MQDRTRINQNRVLEYLRINGGDVKLACKQAEIGRTQFYKWKKTNPEFRKRVSEVEFKILRYSKSQLFKKAIDGNSEALIALKRKMEKNLGLVDS